MNSKFFMNKAVEIAKKSDIDLPIGCLIVRKNEIISSSYNKVEYMKNPLMHSEIMAINLALEKEKSKYLLDCEIYITLEPCPMCAWAIIQSRIKKVYFGAYDLLYGSFGGKIDLRSLYNSNISVYGGILEEECKNLLKNYFIEVRRNVKNKT